MSPIHDRVQVEAYEQEYIILLPLNFVPMLSCIVTLLEHYLRVKKNPPHIYSLLLALKLSISTALLSLRGCRLY